MLSHKTNNVETRGAKFLSHTPSREPLVQRLSDKMFGSTHVNGYSSDTSSDTSSGTSSGTSLDSSSDTSLDSSSDTDSETVQKKPLFNQNIKKTVVRRKARNRLQLKKNNKK
jgi:hypothetical protein